MSSVPRTPAPVDRGRKIEDAARGALVLAAAFGGYAFARASRPVERFLRPPSLAAAAQHLAIPAPTIPAAVVEPVDETADRLTISSSGPHRRLAARIPVPLLVLGESRSCDSPGQFVSSPIAHVFSSAWTTARPIEHVPGRLVGSARHLTSGAFVIPLGVDPEPAMRALRDAVDHCADRGGAIHTPIGRLEIEAEIQADGVVYARSAHSVASALWLDDVASCVTGLRLVGRVSPPPRVYRATAAFMFAPPR